jgi:hypothetical protein
VIRNRIAEAASELRERWPGYQVWYVPRAVGPVTWHARRLDGTGGVLDAGSPDELEKLLQEAEG